MKILGIESSCDETAAAVVQDGRLVLSNIVATQVEEHRLYGGVVPEIASRRHAENIVGVVDEALNKASCTLDDIDAVAVTYAPGLIGALLVGVNFAKGLCLAKDMKLVAVHHLRAHIASNYISDLELKPPFLCLVVSGGHSHIVEVKSYTNMKVIGKTRDDAAGEAFDKAARAMGIPYPGGIELDKIAEEGDENAFDFPHPKLNVLPGSSLYDFSFSGLKTAVINLIHNKEQKGEKIPVKDICAGYRKAVVSCLTDNFLKAAEDLGYKKLVIAGGVSANSLLRRNLESLCQEKGYKLYMPQKSLCSDNAAMVASQGYYEFIAGNVASQDLNAIATLPIDAQNR